MKVFHPSWFPLFVYLHLIIDILQSALSLPFSWAEALIRAGGVASASIGIVVGIAMMFSGGGGRGRAT